MASTRVDNPFRDTDANHRFNPPQSTFSLGRRSRPSPMHLNGAVENENRIPLKPGRMERPDSKSGLRGMFSRNKLDRNVSSPILEDTPPVSAFSERSMRLVAERSIPRSLSIKRAPPITSETGPFTPKATAKMSRMNLRSKSVKESKGPRKTPSKQSPKAMSTDRSSPKTSKSSPQPPIRTSPTWDPPPLFQAYPQAIKHATLSASTLSADAILRISNQMSQAHQTGGGRDPIAAVKKTEKAKTKHRRQMSDSISKAEWTQKIFVLVTSGYLLQYAVGGSFDRLPEKMVKLGKDSVAFASDVIPGKHWVLQISQAMDSDGTPAADPRSLLSRLTFRGADYRRTATSLLLVLDSAEEMDSWMAIVRREIEALGGKKPVSETGKPKPDDNVMQLEAQPIHRYLVQREPGQFSAPSSPQSPGSTPPWNVETQIQESPEQTAAVLVEPQPLSLLPIRPSTSHRSTTNSVISHDEQQLESLRNSTNRFSYMSSGQRTLISSPATSPNRESFSTDDFPSNLPNEDSRSRPNASAISERRRSMQTMSIAILEAHSSKSFRHSTIAGPSRPMRTNSPVTPNFSVPNSSSKRFPTIKSPMIKDAVRPAQDIHIPTIVTTVPSKLREPLPQGQKRAPPVTLTVKVSQSFPPVKDPSSFTRQLQVITPTDFPFKVELVEPSIVDIPPQLPVKTTSFIDEVAPQPRGFSMIPLNTVESSNITFQWELNSQKSDGRQPKPPSRPAPLLPAEALSTPLPNSPMIHEMEKPKTPRKIADKELLPPLPTVANTKSKLRRPISMQIRPTVVSQSPSPRLASKSTLSSKLPAPEAKPAASLLSPAMRRLKIEGRAKLLANRRSMPVLAGPPPAPPPSCALPPLPSGGSVKIPTSMKTMRNSVHV